VAFIDCGPQCVGSGLPREPNGIAKTGSKDSEAAAVRVVFVNHRAAFVACSGVVDVVGRTDGHVQLLAILTEQDVPREVGCASFSSAEVFGRAGRLGVAGGVLITDDAVGVADIEISRLKREAERLHHWRRGRCGVLCAPRASPTLATASSSAAWGSCATSAAL